MKKLENMKNLLLIITATTFLLSCDTKKKTTQENAAGVIVDSTAIIVDSPATTSNTNNISETVPANAVASNADQPGKPALNPAHGEPFHRCDIAVGAPIDSAPAPTPAPQVAPSTMSQNNTGFNTNPISPSASVAPAQASQPTGPKPALNPAHGQPWHKCELQVGAPLT